MINIAIFASGAGSNAKVLLQKAQELKNIKIKLIVTDQKNAGVISIGKDYKVPTFIIPRGKRTLIEHENEILAVLRIYQIEWIFLAGYMKILSQNFLKHFQKSDYYKIINIHPSLLPNYKGLNAFERAFDDQVSESGITVHLVNEKIDDGQIIIQKKFKRNSSDSLADFIAKGKKIEHEIYPCALEFLNNNQLFSMRHICE